MRQIIMKTARMTSAALLATVAIGLAACDPAASAEDDPGQADSQGSTSAGETGDEQTSDQSGDEADADAQLMTLSKSGGFAGVSETVDVTADGGWTYDSGSGDPETGQLSDTETEDLTAMLDDPGLAVTDRPDGSDGQCNDAFSYQLTVGDVTMKTDSCGKAPNEVFSDVHDLLSEATGI